MSKASNKNIGLASLTAFEDWTVDLEQILRFNYPNPWKKLTYGKGFL